MEAQSVKPETPAQAAATAPATTDPTTPAPAATPATPSADEVTEQRVLRLAREKTEIRKQREANKEALAKAEKLAKAEGLVATDPIGALEVLGIDTDQFYLRYTDAVVKRDAPKDPAEVAKQVAADAIKEHEAAKVADATKRAEQAWVADAYEVLDLFPAVTKALATGHVPMSEITRLAWAMAEAGKDTTPNAVLKAVEDYLAPATPASAQPADGKHEGKPETKGKPDTGPPPAALTSNAPPQKPEAEDDLSFEEALAKAKAKHLKR